MNLPEVYLPDQSVLINGVTPVLLITLIVTLVVCGLTLWLNRAVPAGRRGDAVQLAILIFALAVIGATAGYAGGLSRIGVVGDIIPAALAFLGGVSVYLFGVKRASGVIASIGGVAFTLALLSGYTTGADQRTTIDARNNIDDICLSLFNAPDVRRSAQWCLTYDTFKLSCSEVLVRTQKRFYKEDEEKGSRLDKRDIEHALHVFYNEHCPEWQARRQDLKKREAAAQGGANPAKAPSPEPR